MQKSQLGLSNSRAVGHVVDLETESCMGTDVLCLRACRVAVAARVPEKFGKVLESFEMIFRGMDRGEAVAHSCRPAVECWSARVSSMSSKLGTFL
jgi:hypothetical protein